MSLLYTLYISILYLLYVYLCLLCTVVYGLWEYRWLIDQQTIMLKLSRKKIKLSSYRSISLTTAWFQWGFEKQGTFQTSIYGFWLPCGIFKRFMKLLWVFICFYILFHSDKNEIRVKQRYVGMIILIFQQKRDMTVIKIRDSGYQTQNNKDNNKIYHSKHT